MMRNAIASGWDISYFLGFEIGEPVHESLADSFWAEGLTKKKGVCSGSDSARN